MTMSYSNIEYRVNTAQFDHIVEHLNISAPGFIPPLDTYINIEQYAKKIRANAVTFEAWHENKLVGLAAVYYNDMDSKIGFCTNLSILKNYQRISIGSRLINDAINYGIEHGFTKLNLEAKIVNEKAIGFYEKTGFVQVGINNDCYIFSYKLNS
jgi:ribosomal protein S18 acetylase RimI-like enzyme